MLKRGIRGMQLKVMPVSFYSGRDGLNKKGLRKANMAARNLCGAGWLKARLSAQKYPSERPGMSSQRALVKEILKAIL